MSEPKKPAGSKRIDVTSHDDEAAADKPPEAVIIKSRPLLKVPDASSEPSGPPPLDGKTPAPAPTPEGPKKVTREPSLTPLDQTTKVITDKPAEEVPDKPPPAPAEAAPPPTPEPAPGPKAPDDKPDADKAGKTDQDKEPDSTAETDTEEGSGKPAEASDEELDAEAKAQAKHDEAIEKLVETKQYFLPINAVEKRRTKHFVILGVVLSLLLALAWADIALDAGLVEISGVKPVTHFFSN